MSIRNMLPQDIDQVAAIEKEIFSVPWSYKSLLEACADIKNIYLVWEEDHKILGYCGMWTVLGEGNITNVAVSAEARNRGIASALMKELEIRGRARDIEIFFLEVRESNAVARHVYEKCGYRSIGVRKNFYEKPAENGIVMSKIVQRGGLTSVSQ